MDLTVREATADADHVLIVSGATYDSKHHKSNEVVARVVSRAEIDSLIDALEGDDADQASLMTPGMRSFVFLQGKRVLATVTQLSDTFVRCNDLWPSDLLLREPSSLAAWLEEHATPAEPHGS